MPDYKWPDWKKRRLMGRQISRLDGPEKVTGFAKYSYDINRPKMLIAKFLTCPYAHAKITKLDVSIAEKMAGVKAVRVIQNVGSEIQWELDEIAVVAAKTEEIARDAVRAIEVEYQVLSHFVTDEELEKAVKVKAGEEQTTGDPARAMQAADFKVEGYYGIAAITHCCLEPHGQVCEWGDDQSLTAWCSTQNVSGMPGQFSDGLKIPASNVRIITHYMGSGFGSKFSVDRWGIECAELARQTNAPVKLMLDRDEELAVAGDRPSFYAQIQVGAKKDGTLTAWNSKSWGSGGLMGAGSPPLPYVLQIPNRKHKHVSIPTNIASSRAWRAPNHPQACFLTMSALEDLAAELRIDALEFFRRNTTIMGPRSRVYEEELQVCAELMDWKKKWHPRGQSDSGPVKRGLGLGLHTWGGRGHRSNCELTVYPDGSVEAKLGSQDLGTGTKTVVAIVLAETLGLTLDGVKVSIGDSRFPASGASGGSTTVGGVCAASRRAALKALDQIFSKVATHLGVTSDRLEVWEGHIRVKKDPSNSLPWKEAVAKLGVNPITVTGSNPGPGKLTDSGVGGVQMADVSVDVETGVVKINKFVAVQDCGLIVDLKTAESQVYGAVIMGIAYALSEEKVIDPLSGKLLNANMEFYKLPGIGDIGEIVVHMMTGPEYDKRGIIGLGEPPVISPGAAISNAVANAIGVRVPYIPITPDRVLNALDKGGIS